MIEGRFGEEGEIYFEVALIDNDGLDIPVEVMLDTGFTGFLAMISTRCRKSQLAFFAPE